MKLSIIIPTCNEEKDVSKLIECLLKLSLEKEIVVSDDGSTDKTLEVLEKYKDQIKVLAHEKSKSIATNRNIGAKNTNGGFLVFLDATTFLKNPDEFFNYALNMFAKDKNLVALTGKLIVHPELETFGDKMIHFFMNSSIMLKNNYLRMGEASGKFQMIKREAFEKVGGFSENLITREDANMFEKLSKIGKVRYVSSLQIFYNGRRAHLLGWPKLLSIWMINTFWVAIFGKAKSKEWTIIR